MLIGRDRLGLETRRSEAHASLRSSARSPMRDSRTTRSRRRAGSASPAASCASAHLHVGPHLPTRRAGSSLAGSLARMPARLPPWHPCEGILARCGAHLSGEFARGARATGWLDRGGSRRCIGRPKPALQSLAVAVVGGPDSGFDVAPFVFGLPAVCVAFALPLLSIGLRFAPRRGSCASSRPTPSCLRGRRTGRRHGARAYWRRRQQAHIDARGPRIRNNTRLSSPSGGLRTSPSGAPPRRSGRALSREPPPPRRPSPLSTDGQAAQARGARAGHRARTPALGRRAGGGGYQPQRHPRAVGAVPPPTQPVGRALPAARPTGGGSAPVARSGGRAGGPRCQAQTNFNGIGVTPLAMLPAM